MPDETGPFVNDTDEPVDPVQACLYWQRRLTTAQVAITDLVTEVDRLRRLLGDIAVQQAPAMEAYCTWKATGDDGAATRLDLWTFLMEEATEASHSDSSKAQS
jgi:hypothetical protein